MLGDRDSDRPAAGAHVDQPHLLAALDPFPSQLDGRLHHELRLGARNENARLDMEIQAVKLAMAGDIGRRLVSRALSQELKKVALLLGSEQLRQSQVE